MSTTATAATIRLGVDLASLQSGLQKAATIAEQKGQTIKASLLKATDQTAEGFKRLGDSVQATLNPFALVTSAIGLAAGTASLGALIAQSLAAAETMEDLSKVTGINVEQLSRFTTVAKMSGTDMNTVSDIIKKLSISAVDAYSGNEKLARSFKSIGISTTELKNIAPDELLVRVAKGIDGIDPMVLQDLLAQLAGKGASNAIVFLREISERIDETGVKISSQFAKDAGEFNDNLTIMRSNIQSLANSITAQLLPGLNAFLGAMNKGAGPVESFFAKAGLNLNDDLLGQLSVVEKRLRDAEYSREQSDDPGNWQGDIRRLQLQKQMLMSEIDRRKASINPEIDSTKTNAARAAALANNSSSSGTGDNFIKGLEARIQKADQGEYALLRLQAAEKGVAESAAPLIAQLKQLDEIKSIEIYQNELARQNTEIEYQISLIGKSSTEVALLNVEQKLQVDLAKQIEQLEKSKGALSDESVQKMRAATDEAIKLQQHSISVRLQKEQEFSVGAQKAMNKYVADSQNYSAMAEAAFASTFSNMETSLTGFITSGKMDFASLADSIISDLTRIMIRALIIGPIVKAIGGGGDDGGSGLLGSLMDVIGFEKGGVFNSSPSLSAYSNTVQTSPKYFTYGTLNRFANGGVFAEAGPEAVMPLTKMGNGKLGVHSSGSGGVKIIVNNNGSSAQVAAQDRGTDGNGTRQIEIMITDIVAKSLAVGRLDKAMQGAFNIRRTAT